MKIFTQKLFPRTSLSLLLIFTAIWANAASVTYTGASGGNWNVPGNWSNSLVPTSADDVTIPAAIVVNLTASTPCNSLILNGTLAIAPGITLTVTGAVDVSGTLTNAGTISNGGAITFNNGSFYRHNYTTTAGIIPDATWNNGSTCEIVGYTTNTAALTGLGQSFYNFTWNCSGQGANYGDLNGQLTTVNGDFTMAAGNLRFINTGGTGTKTLAIGGNMIIQGGTLNWSNTTAITPVINLNGDFSQTAGTFTSTSTTPLTLNFGSSAANYTFSAGTMTTTNFNIKVLGGAQLTMNNNYATASGRSFTVDNGATLNTASTQITGTGSFILTGGATIITSHANGLSTNGAIATTTRTFSSTADYEFRNAATGTFTTSPTTLTVNRLVINRSSGNVAASQNFTVTSALELVSGQLSIGTTTLTLPGTVTQSGGTLTSAAGGTVNYSQASNGQQVIAATYGRLTFSNFNKVLPQATVTIASIFTPGTATGHTIDNNTISFTGTGQVIPAFSYNNVTASGTKTINATIKIAGTFTPGTSAYTMTNSTVIFNGADQSIPAINGSYNNLTLSSGGVKTLAAAETVTGVLTVDNDVTLDIGANTLTLTAAGTPFVVNGTFNPSGTVSFSGNSSQNISALDYFNLTSSNIARVLPANQVVRVAGTFTPGSGAYTIANSTVEFNGSSAQNIPSISPSYQNIMVSNGGVKTLTQNVTVAGTISINAATELNLAARTLTLTAAGTIFTIDPTGTLNTATSTVTYSGAAGQYIEALNYYSLVSGNNNSRVLPSSGEVGIANVFTPGSGAYTIAGSTIAFNGTGSQTIPMLAPAYNNIKVINGGTATFGANCEIRGVLSSDNASTISLSSRVITLAGSDDQLDISGPLTKGTSTITFNGSGDQNIPAISYYNLTTTGSNTLTLAATGIIDIGNAFTPGVTNTFINTGSTVNFSKTTTQTISTFNYYNLSSDNFARSLASQTVRIAGTFTPGTAAYTVTNSTVDFNGSGNQTIPALGASNYLNLRASNSGTKTLATNIVTAGLITVTDNAVLDLDARTITLTMTGTSTPLIISGSGSTIAGSSTVNYNGTGTQTIAAANFYNLVSSNNPRTLQNTGIIGIANTFTVGTGAYTTTGSTVEFNGSGDQTIPVFTSGNYNNLNTSNGGIKTIAGSGTINGTLNVGAGSTLALGATTITLPLAGTPMIVDGTVDPGTSTVTFTNASSQTIPAANFYNLTSSNAARMLQSSGTIDIENTFTPGTGTYTTTGSTVNFSAPGSQAVPVQANVPYYNLSVSGAGTKTISAVSPTQLLTGNNFGVSAPVQYSNISSIYVTKNFEGTSPIGSGPLAVTIGDDWKNTATGYLVEGDVSYIGATGVTLEVGGVDYTNLSISASRGAGFPVNTAITAPVTVAGTLAIGDNATFTTGGQVTLLSDASSFANVAPLTGSANISGNMKVQVYIKGGEGMRGTRMLSSPINESAMRASGKSIYQQLIDYMVITGPNGPANGFDLGSQAAPYGVTLTVYNESANATQSQFISIGSLLTGDVPTLAPGAAFFLFYRGDRTGYDPEDPNNPKMATTWVPESLSFPFEGPVNQGNITVPITRTNTGDATYDGYNVIGNPYPATIDWEKVYAANPGIENEIRVIKPGGGMMSRKNVEGVVTVVNSNDMLGSQYIQPGQGFYMRKSSDGSSTITFQESHKEITGSPDRLLSLPQNRLLTEIKMGVGAALAGVSNSSAVQFYMNLKDAVNTDEAAIVFKSGFNANFDSHDAPYLSGTTVILSSLSADGKPNAINYMPAIGEVSEVRLNVSASVSGPVTLNFTSVASLGAYKVMLKDNFLNTLTDIKSHPSYAFYIDRTNTATFGNARFVLQFEASTAPVINISSFLASQDGNKVTLNWVTGSEQSSVRFEVERSADGVNYTKIGEKAGAGTTDVSTGYTFSDGSPLTGVNYYRLKQVYTDGTFNYSDVKTVTYVKPVTTPTLPTIHFKLYPNPATDVIFIDVTGIRAKVVVYDLFGRIVAGGSFGLNEKVSVNIGSLRTGIYLAEVRDQNTGKVSDVTIFLKR